MENDETTGIDFYLNFLNRELYREEIKIGRRLTQEEMIDATGDIDKKYKIIEAIEVINNDISELSQKLIELQEILCK